MVYQFHLRTIPPTLTNLFWYHLLYTFCTLFFQEYIKRNGVSVLPEDNLPDTPSPIKSSGSYSSLYGTDVVIEDQKQTVEDVAMHVLYCKFVNFCGVN